MSLRGGREPERSNLERAKPIACQVVSMNSLGWLSLAVILNGANYPPRRTVRLAVYTFEAVDLNSLSGATVSLSFSMTAKLSHYSPHYPLRTIETLRRLI